MKERSRVCCNCRHNIRTGDPGKIKCHCDIDNHYIGYVRCEQCSKAYTHLNGR